LRAEGEQQVEGKQEGFRKKVIQMATGTFLAQGLTVAISPLLTRLYTPTDFGILAVMLTLVGTLATFSSMRYEVALPIPEDEEVAANLLVANLIIVGITTVIAALGVFIFKSYLLRLLQAPQLGPYLWLFPVSLLGIGVYEVLSFWGIRRQAYKMLSRTRITQSLAQVAVQLGMPFFLHGPAGLLVGDAVGRSQGSGTLGRWVLKTEAEHLKKVTKKGMIAALKRYRDFPIFNTSTTFMNNFTLRIPGLFLAAQFGPAVAGLYALGQRVFVLPETVIAASVGKVFYGEAARIGAGDPQGLMKLFWRTVARMTLLGVPVIVALAVAARVLFPIIFGEQWRMGGVYAQYLAFVSLVDFMSSCAGSTIFVLERQGIMFLRELIRLIIVLLAFGYCMLFHVDTLHAVQAYAVSGVLGYLLHGATTWYAIHLQCRKLELAAGVQP
jgi:O-antigen/teichoic acid export membrane protein